MNPLLTDILIILAFLAITLWFGRKMVLPILRSFPEDFHDTFTNQPYLRGERAHLHYRISGSCAFIIIVLCAVLHVAHIADFGIVGTGLFSGFACLVVNMLREGLLQYLGGKDNNGKYNVPFSWLDVRFGMYGGLHFGLLAGLVVKLIMNL